MMHGQRNIKINGYLSNKFQIYDLYIKLSAVLIVMEHNLRTAWTNICT